MWSPPFNLFETEGRASEAEVITDPSGAVHVFWAYGAPDAEDEGWAQAIYYARLQDGAWSKPVDVLVSPDGRVARMPSAAADSDGYLHIVWSGGNALFYSRAYAPGAGSAPGWTPPEALTSGVGALEPAIAVGPDNTLYAVWSQTSAGLMFVRSEDGGQSWSAPQTIFQADRNNELARWGRIAVDETGRLHVVLTYTVNDPEARLGRTDANQLYYLRSDDRGATWREPFLVTPEPDFGEINVATFGEDMVHLVWNGRAGRHGRYHRWSEDGGETWSNIDEIVAPGTPYGNEGLTGFPALVTDSTGVLHVVSTGTPGDFYVRWDNGAWSTPLLISDGVDGNGVTRTSHSVEQPSLTLSEGNQLHTVFHDGFERIWYTGAIVDAPHEPPLAVPPPELEEAAPIAGTASLLTPTMPSQLPTVTGPRLPVRSAPPADGWPISPIVVSILPAMLLVGVVVFIYSIRRRR